MTNLTQQDELRRLEARHKELLAQTAELRQRLAKIRREVNGVVDDTALFLPLRAAAGPG